MSRRFTGRHMAVILVSFFGLVIAVNLTMARFAISTFGGVVVENSYVASQHFNRWLDEARSERALGWTAAFDWRDDRRLAVTMAGLSGPAELRATVHHPLGRLPDRVLRFSPMDKNTFISTDQLPEGRWLLRLEVRSGGKVWRHQEKLG